jgi:polyribonucleotide nucleotidyltransferase
MNNYYELNPPMYSSNSTYSGLYNETSALDTNSDLKHKTIQIQEELVKEMNEDFDIAYEERPELKQVQMLLEDYRKINDKYMKDSRELKEAMKQSEREIEILNSHSNYIRKLQDTYTSESDDSFSYLVKDIEALSLKIKENNDLKEIYRNQKRNVKLLKFD